MSDIKSQIEFILDYIDFQKSRGKKVNFNEISESSFSDEARSILINGAELVKMFSNDLEKLKAVSNLNVSSLKKPALNCCVYKKDEYFGDPCRPILKECYYCVAADICKNKSCVLCGKRERMN